MVLPNLPYYRLFRKTISLLVAASFIFSNIAFADIPKTPILDTKEESHVITDPEKIIIPRDYGLIKAKYTAKDSRKLIIHIQDAHCNYEAQSNIIKILECLIKNDGLKLVSVEGADGFIDTSWFKAFPDSDIRKEVADYFMKKGEITGPEFLSITSDYPVKLFGAETRSYYIENLNAFTSSYPLKEDTEKYYNQIKAALNKLKNNIYNEELKEFDQKQQDYESKKLSFTDYVKYLEDLAGRHKVSLRQYENLFKLISVLIYEKKINFNVVDKERATLIDAVTKKLDKDQLAELVNKSLEFKVSRISSAEYYNYLRNLATKYGISLPEEYPNLFNYIIYNSVYSKIENEQLFNDIKKFEEAVKDKLFENDDQRTLDKLSRHINILLGLVNIKLLNGDFDYYKARKEEFTHEVFADFISKMAVKFGFAFEIDPPSEAVSESMPKLEDFYAIAIKRDKALVDNTIQAMKKEDAQVSVLVTGGFHSEGITKLLEKQGVSYLVICPNITKDVETPYIKILTNQRTPLEEILSDTGAKTADAKNVKDGMLAPILISGLVPLSPQEIRDMFSDINTVEKRPLDELVSNIADRQVQVKGRWEALGITIWLRRAMNVAGSNRYARDEDVMLDAYRYAMEAALVRELRLSQDVARELAAKITGRDDFKVSFHEIYLSLRGDSSVSAAKSFPAGEAAPRFDINQRIQDLLEIFSGDKALFSEYLRKAGRSVHLSDGELLKGMFNPVSRYELEQSTKLQPEKLSEEIKPRGPPNHKKRIMAFGGGSGLIASIKPLVKLDAFVESVQTSVDDGGSTFRMVKALRDKGYGWMPSPGDLANSIFKGFASADKLYKLLDDQGRIALVTKDMANEAKREGNTELYNVLINNIGKMIFYGEGSNGENKDIVIADSLCDLCKKLLSRIVREAIITKRGVGYTVKTTRLEEDFVYFAASILNIAQLIDNEYFKDNIIDKDRASIRNLVLLAAMDYLGLIRAGKPAYENGSRKPMINSAEDKQKFQLALDLMARLGRAESKGMAALSFFKPETLYAIYRDNIIIIKSGSDLHIVKVRTEKDKIIITIPELPENDPGRTLTLTGNRNCAMVRIGKDDRAFELTLKMDAKGNFVFGVNDSGEAILKEPAGAIEKASIFYHDKAAVNPKFCLLSTDGTGLVRHEIKDAKGNNLTDAAGNAKYEYRPLEMGGKTVYVRNRLITMQTNISEVPNYSKIEKIGFTEEGPIEAESVNGEIVYRLKPSTDTRRAEANEDVIKTVADEKTGGIIFGPGSFFTSIIPHLLTKGLPEALVERRKKNDIPIVLVINPSVDNETAGYSINEMLDMIKSVTGCNIDEMFTDIVINKFDTTKLEEHFGITSGKPMPAKWYVNKVLENPNLLDEVGLTYFKHLINKFLSLTDTPLHALSCPNMQRFSILNDDGAPITVVSGEPNINLAEYLEYKIEELLKTLYQEPKPEIRTDPGRESNEAKKSRGPLSYTTDEIDSIKRENRNLRVYRELFLAGVDFTAPRSPGKPATPTVSFITDYTSYILGEIFGLIDLNMEVAQAYDTVAASLPQKVLDEPRDKGAFKYIFTTKRPHLMRLLDPRAQLYLGQLSLEGFRRAVDRIHIKQNQERNARDGYGISLVADMPISCNMRQKQDFSELIAKILKELDVITSGRIEYYNRGNVGKHMTIATIVRTRNFDKGNPLTMQEALQKVREKVLDIEQTKSMDLGETIAGFLSACPSFSVKIAGLEYDMKSASIRLVIKPSDSSSQESLKNLLESLLKLPIEARRDKKLYVQLGCITRPLDQRQIDSINTLFDRLGIRDFPVFEITSLNVILYRHRTLKEKSGSLTLQLHGDADARQVFSFVPLFEREINEIDRIKGEGAVTKSFPAGEENKFHVSERVGKIIDEAIAKAARPISPEIVLKMKIELTALETTINTIVLSGVERKPVIIAHDTGLDLDATIVAQAAESYLEEYYGGKLIIARGRGEKLAEKIDEARQKLNDADTVVVTIAGNDTLEAITIAAQRDHKNLKDVVGTVLNVQINKEEPYIPFAMLYNLAFRIAYDQIDENTISLLNAFMGYVANDNRIIPFTSIDQLRQGIIRILPRVGRVNPEEAREAYKAAAQALRSL